MTPMAGHPGSVGEGCGSFLMGKKTMEKLKYHTGSGSWVEGFLHFAGNLIDFQVSISVFCLLNG